MKTTWLIALVLISIVLVSGCVDKNIDCQKYPEEVKNEINLINNNCQVNEDCIQQNFNAEFGCRKCFNKNENIDDIMFKVEKFYTESKCPIMSLACQFVTCECVDNICTEIPK